MRLPRWSNASSGHNGLDCVDIADDFETGIGKREFKIERYIKD
jgi:hypothetical protein